MKTNDQYDVIILGLGIAGTLVAYEMHRRGKRVLAIDSAYPNSASRVAAGMWNPVAFKRFTLTWNLDQSEPLMRETYRELEKMLDTRFFFERKIRRIIPDEDAFDRIMMKTDLPGFRSWVEKLSGSSEWSDHGEVHIRGAGYVDTNVLTESMRKFLEEQGQFLEMKLDDSEIEYDKGHWHVAGAHARQLVCCRGVSDLDSAWWSFLPIQPNKGEVLTVEGPIEANDTIMNNGKFALPTEEGRLRLGATFNWRTPDEIPTREGKDEILGKFTQWYSDEYQVIDHRAGLRPTVKDRRPLAGKHPEIDELFILNGLGSRGIMNGPYCARALADRMLDEKDLPREIDIGRF